MTAKNEVNAKAITSDQLEKMFDNGDDILDYVDLDNPVVEHHPPLEKRITLTMPAWMVSAMALMVVAAGSAHVHPHTGPSACTSVAMAGSTISASHLSTS